MDSVQHGEPGDLMASLQCGPVQCFQQAADMGGVSISAKQVQSGLLIIALLQLCGIADS